MDAYNNLSTLSFEVKIIRAKNIEFKAAGDWFIRCYLPAGRNKRVQLNTKEMSSISHLFWDQNFSLKCHGSQEAINSLSQGNVVLELRWRSTCTLTLLPLIGRTFGSKLIGRAEIPWRYVFDSPNMEIFDTWICMNSKNRKYYQDFKPPKVQVSMKIINISEEKTKMSTRRWGDGCGCKDGGCCHIHACVDYDFYAIGCALEGLKI